MRRTAIPSLLKSKMKTDSTPSARAECEQPALFDLGSPPCLINRLPEKLVGRVNPTWAEWFMGWPMGWTELRPLEMDKFRQWSCSHGNFLDLSQMDNEA